MVNFNRISIYEDADGSQVADIPLAGVAAAGAGYDPEQGTNPSKIKENRYTSLSNARYTPWGVYNLWPQEVVKKLEDSTIALSSIQKLGAMMYGRLIYFKERDQNGMPMEMRLPEVDTFLKRNMIKKYLMCQIMDYRFFMNTFPELILNKRRDKIVRLVHQDASYARLSRQNPRSRKIEYVGYSANWPTPTTDEIEWVRLIDEHDMFGFIDRLRGAKFAWWCYFPSPGKTYYKFPYWGGLYKKDGWLDVANEIPKIISSMHRNQIVLKYHIHIPSNYWTTQYPEWDTYTEKKRRKLYKDKVKEINDFLKGTKNYFKSFTTVFKVDEITGKAMGDWKIEAVDDKTKKDAYIPNSQAADSQIVQALGLDPSQQGLQPNGGKMGGGSGSDKRVSFTNHMILNTIEQDVILEPLQFISEFNGWDVEFAFTHKIPGRLDQSPNGTESI